MAKMNLKRFFAFISLEKMYNLGKNQYTFCKIAIKRSNLTKIYENTVN